VSLRTSVKSVFQLFSRLYCIISAHILAKFSRREVYAASPVLAVSIDLGKSDIDVRTGQSTGLNVR